MNPAFLARFTGRWAPMRRRAATAQDLVVPAWLSPGSGSQGALVESCRLPKCQEAIRALTLARLLASLVLVTLAPSLAATTNEIESPTILVVVGAAGEEEYAKIFAQTANRWRQTAEQAGARWREIGQSETNAPSDLGRLEGLLADEPKQSSAELWLVLIGHGTSSGRDARFNLRGPDLSASALAGWLKPFRRPVVVLNTASSSGPFLNALSGPGRAIVTATRSGYEQNFTRLGPYLAEAIADPKADLDRDGQTSLLEAFLMAARRVAEFYQTEGRLATEHALLDDNGDGLGTPADWFRGVRAVKRAAGGASLDGLRAHQLHLIRSAPEQKLSPAQRARRDELEQAIARLRESKPQLPEDDYYRQLETLLLELAQLVERPPNS